MSLLHHFDHHSRKQDKEHFIHLVQIARADGVIEDSEFDMLHRIGRNMGLTDPEIDDLIGTTKSSDYIPPYELSKRFEQLYYVMKMVWANDNADPSEVSLASRFAVKSGFNLKEIPHVIALMSEGIKNKTDEEELFEEYKRKRKSFL